MIDCLIVGSGFAGLCAAIKLKERGRSFTILEKASGLGGTWRANHYPGCACDIPSHLYSFSFAPNPKWSRQYAPQSEILQYLEEVTDRYDLRRHIEFNQEVVRCEWRDNFWQVHLGNGQTRTARWLVLGIGALSRPSYAKLEGLDKFRGQNFHSAEWNHDFSLEGKSVAVIGTGASAIQFVPQIAPRVGNLHLFQRTPPWVLPRPDRPIRPLEQKLFSLLPIAQRLQRYGIYWTNEARAYAFTVDPRLMKLVMRFGKKHIAHQIKDPALRAKVTPHFMPGCKRVLMANDYYPTLARRNVEVVTDGISHVTENAVVTSDGRERKVDAIIHGTGFHVTDFLTNLQIIGKDGTDLNDAWRNGVEAYLGSNASGYPNMFMMCGPNTGLGHNSMVFMIEAQVHHMLECMRAVEKRGAIACEIRADAQHEFNRGIQPRLKKTVWASGCKSWYLDDKGNNPTLWPGFTVEFWLKTRKMDQSLYLFHDEVKLREAA
jgi:cation diffusion facilitator CzcD-associated flavoprotein CzcO